MYLYFVPEKYGYNSTHAFTVLSWQGFKLVRADQHGALSANALSLTY